MCSTGSGSGVSRGVNYAYTFAANATSGRYECRVHRFFLDGGPVQVDTKPFLIGGRLWFLRIYGEEEHLGVFLCAKSFTKETAHFSLTLTHPDDNLKTNTTSKEFTKAFGWRNSSWGTKTLVPILALQDTTTGYLSGDVFTIRLILRLRRPENELYTCDIQGDTAECTWKLKGFREFFPSALCTDDITIGDSKWRLVLQHNGRHLSAYLRSRCDAPYNVHLDMSATGRLAQAEYRSKFTRKIPAFHQRGWRRFINTEAVLNEDLHVVRDGWVTFEAKILLLAPEKDDPIEGVPERTPPENEGGNECVICLCRPRTSGVLHGLTSHRCYCLDCAREMASRPNHRCPICRLPVESLIERYF